MTRQLPLPRSRADEIREAFGLMPWGWVFALCIVGLVLVREREG